MMKFKFYIILIFLIASQICWAADPIRIGSKRDTEGYLLGEILAQLIENQTDLKVERRFGLGGTVVCFEAIRTGAIDFYLEYSGSIQMMNIDKWEGLDWPEVQKAVRETYHLEWLEPLGFNNTYIFAVRKEVARERGLSKVSDLKENGDLVFGLSHEFLNRNDGWLKLQKKYGLYPDDVRGLEHGLAYQSIAAGNVDVIDAYSTDAKIAQYDLALLEDDLNFFPEYLGAVLIRSEILDSHGQLKAVLEKLSGTIDEKKMQKLNAKVQIEGKSFAEVARGFLASEGLLEGDQETNEKGLLTLIGEHLFLTFVAVGLAILVGVPLGIFISRRRRISQIVLGIAGIAQTIPSIALLVFMIPFFGIGAVPAIVALFIYGLLPIVRNTAIGIRDISPVLLEAADGIGLTKRQRLIHVELPLALRVILAGIRTSAVIAIGTATLAAFIGAGGLGEPIVSGLALNNMRIVLSGAIPAAGLAIFTELFFEGVERWATPRGLKIGL